MEMQPLIQQVKSIFALLKLTLSLFKRFLLPILCITAALHITSVITLQLIKPEFWFSRILGLISYFALIAINTSGLMVIYKASAQAISGLPTHWGDIRKTVKENFWRYTGTGILLAFVCLLSCLPTLISIFISMFLAPIMGPLIMIIGVIIGLALLILPIIVFLNVALIFPAMIVEELKCYASWIRSKDLMKGNRLRLALAGVMISLLHFSIIIVVGLMAAVTNFNPDTLPFIFGILNQFTFLFWSMFSMVFYFDVRGLKEPKKVIVENVEIEILI